MRRFLGVAPDTWLVDAINGLFVLNGQKSDLPMLAGPALADPDHVVGASQDASVIFKNRSGRDPGGAYRLDLKSQKLEEIAIPEPMVFQAPVRLSGGGLLVGTDRGIYRIDQGNLQMREPFGVETGAINVVQALDDGGWLVGSAFGAFRLDAKAAAVDSLQGAQPGAVNRIQRANDGAWLIGSDRGFFRADPGAKTLTQFTGRKIGRVLDIQKLAHGGWFLRSDNGIFLADADGKRVDLVLDEAASNAYLLKSSQSGFFYRNQGITYFYTLARKANEAAPTAITGRVISAEPIGDAVLVLSKGGTYRLDAQKGLVTRLTGAASDQLTVQKPLGDAGWLVGSEDGLFRAGATASALEKLKDGDIGPVRLMETLADGGVLVGGPRGLFKVASSGLQVSPVPGATADVRSIAALDGGGWIVGTTAGLLSVDRAGSAAGPVPSPPASGRLTAGPSSRGQPVIGGQEGLLGLVASFDGASLEAVSSGGLTDALTASYQSPVWNFRHPCASVAERLGLAIEATSGSGPALRRSVEVSTLGPGVAQLTAAFGPLGSGEWSFKLISTAQSSPLQIGPAIRTRIDTPPWDVVRLHWKWLLGGIVIAQVALGAVLIVLSRWVPFLLKLLVSPIFAWLWIWPFFVLRRSGFVQSWLLRGWSAKIRRSLPTPAPFVDIPVRQAGQEEIAATELIARLVSYRRIWLRGRAGMGKTTLCTAWERVGFEAPSIRRHGFVLVAISPDLFPTSSAEGDAEEWVAGAAENRLRQAGLSVPRRLLLALVRNGRLALCFDAVIMERDRSLLSFARQNAKARLLVASDEAAPATFEAWDTPSKLSELAPDFLTLWLGLYSGPQLAEHLARERLLAGLETVYDFRLIANLVMEDAVHVLPTDRFGIYRSFFTDALEVGGKNGLAEKLKAAAWAMTLSGQQNLPAEILAEVDGSLLERLTEGLHQVLRPAAGGYVFAHSLLQSCLSAQWLFDNRQGSYALKEELEKSPIWACRPPEQREFWAFLSYALSTEDLHELWRFALQDPERVSLQTALHARGCERSIFPAALTQGLRPTTSSGATPRLVINAAVIP